MKGLSKPSYTKYITRTLKRFDDRNTGFSRGAVEGDKYRLMFQNGVDNVAKKLPGKTILDHAIGAAARTPDLMFRKTAYARNEPPAINKKYRLQTPDPIAMTKIIKNMARWIGSDLVAVTKLNPSWIYTNWGLHNVMYTNAAKEGDPIDIPPEYQNVIVMIHEMDYDHIRRSPAREGATSLAYSKMAWCASSLSTFIRELGYGAIPCGNELGLSIPMAVDAGLGELGRHGLLITRDFGPRIRISKVFTNLPLIADFPIDIGVQKFCEKCKLCAKHCPSRAIQDGKRTDRAWDKSNSEGLLKWPIRAMNCFEWWVKNGNGCSVCIRVCPWNKPNNLLHKFVRIFPERDLFTKLILNMDQRFGYGRQSKAKGYGSLQDPSVTKIDQTVARKGSHTNER